ncbi:hypothetical protein FEM48_Zijuj02G0023800 [Ziziphus jujuba var. spinosa]|uniref:HORMA domain-containing protein n=1 Tax=Ziziphus jujuba var. spinosa TaxID=714518 RepID=A0A978VT25_ZIZJJ|nr:hypothetical protein FEM48_Zijuj02G0023800 [Ziziphus jujuba var. spinosa]
MKQNLCHYRTSYAVLFLFIFFLSLFGHSFSMDNGHPDQLRVRLLSCLPALLLLTHVWLNVLVSILIGSALAGLHALFRGTEDLHSDRSDQEPHQDRELVEVVDVGNNPNTTTPTASDADQEPHQDRQRVDVVDVGNPTTTTTTASNVADWFYFLVCISFLFLLCTFCSFSCSFCFHSAKSDGAARILVEFLEVEITSIAFVKGVYPMICF